MPDTIVGDSVSEVATLLGIFVRAVRATRVLEIGTGDGRSGLAIAEALPERGMLITLERDASTAARARHAFAAAGHADSVSVMIGEASRFLHKIAGPFDLIFHDGDAAQYEGLHERLVALLAPGGTLLTHNITEARGYNGVLAADARLNTVILPLENGVAISVLRRKDP